MHALGSALVACVLAVAVLPVVAAPGADAAQEPSGTLVSERPAPGTPHVLDGKVLSVARVGRTVVLGGSFTKARNAGQMKVLHRRGLLAFDARTGKILRRFDPDPDGPVNVVRASGSGAVYVGGEFDRIGGKKRARLALLRVARGRVVARFDPRKVDGDVTDLRLHRGRLWVAGSFARIGGARQRALATVRPRTGRATGYLRVGVAGTHRGLGRTMVFKIDITPDGRRLVGIGNFSSVGGARREQVLQLDLGDRRARRAPFSTSFYSRSCKQAFYTYVRDVAYAPDGSFFVVATTGGYRGPTSPCDSVARFETRAGGGAAPSWVAHTGGDTVHAVEVTRGAVYVGGHHRWFNNPYGRNKPGPGAVSREGIAALSAVNGLPYSWNPGRTKGVGVFDFLPTAQGLWVASDTNRIGHYKLRSRIALMLPGGPSYPAWSTPPLPTLAYIVEGDGLTSRAWAGTSAGQAEPVPGGAPDWRTVRGAFLLDGQLYLARSNGTLTRRRFDGAGFGPAVRVSGVGSVKAPKQWRQDLKAMRAMFYDRGRIYYTRRGAGQLYYRYFNPESGVVGAARLVARHQSPAFRPGAVRGMSVAGRYLHWTTGDGRLRRARWQQTPQAGRTVGPAAVVSGPTRDGVAWDPLFFLGQPAAPDSEG